MGIRIESFYICLEDDFGHSVNHFCFRYYQVYSGFSNMSFILFFLNCSFSFITIEDEQSLKLGYFSYFSNFPTFECLLLMTSTSLYDRNCDSLKLQGL